MRPLIFILAFFAANIAHAESPSYRLTTSLHDESGTAGLITTTSPSASSTLVTSFDGSTGSAISPNVSARYGYDRVNPDYSRYLILDRAGNATPLSDLYHQPESVARLGADFTAKHFTFSIDGAKTVSDTPFAGGSFGATASYDAYETGSRYALSTARSDYGSPLSYYDNPETFQTLQRPTRYLENRITGAWEQVLTEILKSRLEAFAADHPDSLPGTVGGEGSLAVAIGNRTALIGKLGTAHQRRDTAIYDDRGYLDASWLQLEYRIEPTSHWAFTGGAGTVYETESSRGVFPLQRIGTDTLSIGARTRQKFLELGVSALGAFSNTGYQSIQVGGDLLWQI